MTDIELLELAAKAISLPECGWMGPAFMYVKDNRFTDWSPLTDDGDALRLAVKLNLIVECMVGQSAARTFDSKFGGCVDHSATQQYPKRDFHPDPYAATRRAIVRAAAAEIGEKQ